MSLLIAHREFHVAENSRDVALNAAIDLLRANGFVVLLPEKEWETPGQFRTRLGISCAHFSRNIERGIEVFDVQAEFGHGAERRRVLRLRSNRAWEADLLKHKGGAGER